MLPTLGSLPSWVGIALPVYWHCPPASNTTITCGCYSQKNTSKQKNEKKKKTPYTPYLPKAKNPNHTWNLKWYMDTSNWRQSLPHYKLQKPKGKRQMLKFKLWSEKKWKGRVTSNTFFYTLPPVSLTLVPPKHLKSNIWLPHLHLKSFLTENNRKTCGTNTKTCLTVWAA